MRSSLKFSEVKSICLKRPGTKEAGNDFEEEKEKKEMARGDCKTEISLPQSHISVLLS